MPGQHVSFGLPLHSFCDSSDVIEDPLLEISAGEVHLLATELLEGEQLVTVVAFNSLSSLDHKKCRCLR